MKVLLLANNLTGVQIATFLKSRSDAEIVGVVIHEKEKQKHADEIVKAAGVSADRIFDGSQLGSKNVLTAIKALGAEIGISVFFGYILKKEFLSLFPRGCINVHPAYLPFGRGAYPNVFSIIEKTPAGASIHYIDEGIDTGDIIARKQIDVLPTDTGESLYHRLEKACTELFGATWPAIVAGKADRIAQSTLGEGTLHRREDLQQYDEIDPKKYTAEDLNNIIRARTFPPYPGAYVRDDKGNKIYLRVELVPEN